MNYSELKSFLIDKMKMSHVYQPVMLRYLLINQGAANDQAIAAEISQHDPTQIEYYRSVTNSMVGRVLLRHGLVEKIGNSYILKDYKSLSEKEIIDLVETCTTKLDEYLKRRGNTVFEHRSKRRRLISGSIKYEVLRRANFRCELCGIMHSDRALEVDHIVPKNLGGEDSINNYQALCYVCNATKRDKDVTDFRGINDKYSLRNSECIFCKIEDKRIIAENNLAYLIFDKYPVSLNHALVIPKRHFSDYFEIFQPELNAIQSLLLKGKEIITKTDQTVEGFNVGVNSGIVAGQTVFHCHLHLIPRRKDDVSNPQGGVRHVIPGKGAYQ